jgi:glycosyltransferase involved in cell wall biosynthesis
MPPTLSVIMPVYNEKDTVREIVQRVRDVDLVHEIIIVDDGSQDGTRDILQELSVLPNIIVVEHAQNQGKGAAVVTGIRNATGELLVVQDADLEYDPKDYAKLIQPLLEGRCDVVYGSRFGDSKIQNANLMNLLANHFLTFMTNLLYGSELTDMETCYKVFRREVVEDMTIRSRRFEFEPEFTAKVLKRKLHLIEVPISFDPRGYSEGKKITAWDGVVALWTLIKYRFVD